MNELNRRIAYFDSIINESSLTEEEKESLIEWAGQTIEKFSGDASYTEEFKLFQKMLPHIREELSKEIYNNASLQDIAKRDDELLQELIVNASQSYAKTLPQVGKVDKYKMSKKPTDVISTNFWNSINEHKDGQMYFSSLGQNAPDLITLSVNFDILKEYFPKIAPKLSMYDMLVYNACGNLWNQGYIEFFVSDIYYAMGYDKKCSATDIQKINDSLSKMFHLPLFIDNHKEVIQTHGKYKSFELQKDCTLLPAERITVYNKNNQTIVNGAIRLYREPPFFTFAKERNQIMSISRDILRGALSFTDQNIKLHHYLLNQIGAIKSKRKRKRKFNDEIKFTTIYEHLSITDKKSKQRLKDKLDAELKLFKDNTFISGYEIKADRIKIIINDDLIGLEEKEQLQK